MASSWAAVAKAKAAAPASAAGATSVAQLVAAGSSGGSDSAAPALRLLVVDANAIIDGVRLEGLAERAVTIQEVLDEIRDKHSRAFLAALPYELAVSEPSEASLVAVTRFSRATGDVTALSATDIKLMALAHSLEVAAHGESHLAAHPNQPRVHSHPAEDTTALPGWGSVANPEDWAAVDAANDADAAAAEAASSSRIARTVQQLSLDPAQAGSLLQQHEAELPASAAPLTPGGAGHGAGAGGGAGGGKPAAAAAGPREQQQQQPASPADGDAAAVKGGGTADDDDWEVAAVSKAAARHRRRKAVRKQQHQEAFEAEWEEHAQLVQQQQQQEDRPCDTQPPAVATPQKPDERAPAAAAAAAEPAAGAGGSSSCSDAGEEDDEDGGAVGATNDELLAAEHCVFTADDDDDSGSGGSADQQQQQQQQAPSGPGAAAAAAAGAAAPRPGWPGWASSVAIITGDFAMQNVLLQMGLRLLTADGRRIARLSRYALRCPACFAVTREPGRLFCPKCGSLGLDRVEVVVGPDGTHYHGVAKRHILRGTRFSLPKPKGGRGGDGDLVLREDVFLQRVRALGRRAPTGAAGKQQGSGEGADSSSVDPFAPEYSADTWHVPSQQELAQHRGLAAVLQPAWKHNPNERKLTRSNRRG